MKNITRREVLLHNQPDDCWVIIRNQVYDITTFIQKHPGGSRILLTRAGDDATSYFEAKHGNNPRIQQQLSKFLIGELVLAEQVDQAAFEEPFFEELVAECHKNKLYHVESKRLRKYNIYRVIALLTFFTLCFFAFLFLQNKIIAIAAVVLQGVIGTSLFGLVAHEHIHRNFPKQKSTNIVLQFLWPLLWPFIPRSPLEFEHNNHHIKIGDPEYDFEVAGFAPFIRYSGTVELTKWHKFQYRLAKYFYPFYANIITTIGAAKSKYWTGHNRNMNKEHILSIVWTFVFYTGIPWLITGNLGWALLLYLVYQSTLFIGIYIGSAINHFVPPIFDEIPEANKNKMGYYACHNTTNFCADSDFWFLYTGGFNVQIEHHLIPFVPVENLRKMIPIVKALCKKYNYPYHNYKSVSELWTAHYDYLAILSEDSNQQVAHEVLNKTQYQAR